MKIRRTIRKYETAPPMSSTIMATTSINFLFFCFFLSELVFSTSPVGLVACELSTLMFSYSYFDKNF